MLTVFISALVAAFATAGAAGAQFPNQIGVGSTIRYSSSAGSAPRTTGTVTRRTADTLFVAVGPGPAIALRVENVSQLEVRIPGRTHKAKYGAIGLIAGSLLGVVIGNAQKTECPPQTICVLNELYDDSARVGFGIIGGVLGGVGGIAVGRSRRDRWEPVIR